MGKLLIVLFALINTLAFSQGELVTTFILVRHAEKDLTQSTNDPDLSTEGKVRAKRFVEILKKTELQAIYSTPFKRTHQTVEPIASVRGIEIRSYQPGKMEEIDSMLTKFAGKTIVVTGHSNTIPQIANYLLGEEKYKVMDDNDYSNIIIVSVGVRGENAKVVWLSY